MPTTEALELYCFINTGVCIFSQYCNCNLPHQRTPSETVNNNLITWLRDYGAHVTQDKETATITKAADDAAARAVAGDAESPSSATSWEASSSSAGGGGDLDAYIQKLITTPTPGQAVAGEGAAGEAGGKGELVLQLVVSRVPGYLPGCVYVVPAF